MSAAVFVELMQGYHDMTSTLAFRKPLGGTVVVRAYQGQEVHVVSTFLCDVLIRPFPSRPVSIRPVSIRPDDNTE